MPKDKYDETKTNGWNINKKLVLHRQEALEAESRSLRKRVERLERQMAVHATKARMAAGVIGAISGLIPAILSILLSRM